MSKIEAKLKAIKSISINFITQTCHTRNHSISMNLNDFKINWKNNINDCFPCLELSFVIPCFLFSRSQETVNCLPSFLLRTYEIQIFEYLLKGARKKEMKFLLFIYF